MIYIKKNLLSIIAIVISVTAFCLVCLRIEPIEFNNGTIIAFVTGLMGVCATVMVASQIMGLRMSEKKVKSMLDNETEKIREASHKTTIFSLIRVEMLAATMSAEAKSWNDFTTEIGVLTSYIIDIKDVQKANEVSKILIDTEISYRFYKYLSKEDKIRLRSYIFSLIKFVEDPRDLITLFNVLHTIE